MESALRCPHCRAAARPGAPWCTLCHADLRPPPPTALEPEPGPVLALPPTAAGPTWPCATCGAANPLAARSCGACGAGFLAGLREAEGPLLELPGVGDLTRLSRGARMGLAFGVVLAVIALTALLGLLLG